MGNRVGVNVTRTSAGPMATGGDPGDSVFMAVTAERGLPNVAHLITSHAQYRTVFGGANGTPYSDGTYISQGDEVARKIFEKTNARLYVTRVVASGATQAKVTIPDRYDEEEDETVEDSITVHAKGHGVWANPWRVVVADGTRANTFKLTLQSSTDGLVFTTVEVFDNLSMTTASLATVGEQSPYIYLENKNSANADPRPASENYPLNTTTAGTNGNNPDAAAIVGTDSSGVKTGLKVFRDRRLGRGFLIAPGMDHSNTTVRAEMIAQFDLFYHYPLFGTVPASSASTVVTYAGTVPTGPCKLVYPNEIVEDEITGGLKEISPVGTVLGHGLKFVRPGRTGGLGKHWAGKDFTFGRIATQTNGQPLIDETVAELLMAKGVCPIWDRGDGNQLLGDRDWYGATYPTWKSGHASYLWAHVADRTDRALNTQVFENVNPVFFQTTEAGLYSMLYDMAVNGHAFYGQIPAPGETADMRIHAFDVKCREEMMTPTDIANNTPRVRIVFNDSVTAETIEVEIAKNNIA